MNLAARSALALASLVIAESACAQLASYDAGDAGNPPVAPDPLTQGWTLNDGGAANTVLVDVSPDGATGLNAWQLDDAFTDLGSRADYRVTFTPAEINSAAMQGWIYTTEMRLLATNGFDVVFEYATGQSPADVRYIAWFEVAGNDVLATFFLSGITYNCVGAMDGDYHEFTFRKPPGGTVVDAEFYYDGALMGPLPAGASSAGAPPGGVSFGTGSSPATASVNFHSVEFRLIDGGVPLCFGDGSGSPCACANESTPGSGSGCRNSTGAGALLAGTGIPSLSNDTLVLMGTSLPPGQPGLFFQGDQPIAGGAGTVFGDGIRCCGMNVVRLATVAADAGGCSASDASCGTAIGGMPGSISQHPANSLGSGDTRCYQLWYRDPGAGAPCGTGFNLSNALELTWGV